MYDQYFQTLPRAARRSGPGYRQDRRSKWGGRREGLRCEGGSDGKVKQPLLSRYDFPPFYYGADLIWCLPVAYAIVLSG